MLHSILNKLYRKKMYFINKLVSPVPSLDFENCVNLMSP